MFITPFGRFFYKRLPFGISSASEIFQRTMQNLIGDIDSVEIYQDDTLLHSKSQKEHEVLKEKVFKRIAQSGLTVNKSKCEFDKTSITFLGHMIDSTGVKPCPSRVAAIDGYSAATDLTQLCRFLGMVNYVSRFIPHLADTLHPLNDLLQKDTAWTSGSEQERSLKHFLKVYF